MSDFVSSHYLFYRWKKIHQNKEKEKTMSKKAPTILESPDLVAFISLFKKTNPRPYKRNADSRIVFEFSEDVSEAVDAFYRNVPVNIADYCKTLKMIRSMIFNVKAGNA